VKRKKENTRRKSHGYRTLGDNGALEKDFEGAEEREIEIKNTAVVAKSKSGKEKGTKSKCISKKIKHKKPKDLDPRERRGEDRTSNEKEMTES